MACLMRNFSYSSYSIMYLVSHLIDTEMGIEVFTTVWCISLRVVMGLVLVRITPVFARTGSNRLQCSTLIINLDKCVSMSIGF